MKKLRSSLFLSLLVALVCVACGDSAATSTPVATQAAAVTPSVAGLKQLVTYLTSTQDALKKNDIAAAKAAYTEFDSRWYDQEDPIRTASLDLYRKIENDMTSVGRALLRTEKPDAATVSTALVALQTSFTAGISAAEKAPVATTTKSAPITGAEVDAATEKVKTYLIGQSDTLVKATTDFTTTVRARDIAAAKTDYTTARYSYEGIEFLAEAFKEMDVAIDARPDAFPNGESDKNWTGFHPLEKALFVDGTLDARTDSLATQLVTDVTKLRDEIKKMTIDPSVAINGAAELIEEIQAGKITGEEERYSRTDLNDFRANLVSARFVYDSYAALVRQRNPVLDSEVADRFTAVEAGLAPYIDAQGKAALYTAVDDASRKALAQKVEALADSFSRVAPTLGIK